MPDRVNRPAFAAMRWRRAGIALLMAAPLAGCATGSTNEERMGSFFVAPGKYQFYTCGHLTQATNGLKQREKELEGLIAKAGTGSGGSFVSAVAYRPEILQVRGNLAEVRREEAAKNCPPAVAEAPPKPAAPGAAARKKR